MHILQDLSDFLGEFIPNLPYIVLAFLIATLGIGLLSYLASGHI